MNSLLQKLQSHTGRYLTRLVAHNTGIKRAMLHELFIGQLHQKLYVVLEFDDHKVMCDPKDTVISPTLLSGVCWQRDELSAALSLVNLSSEHVFIDVGANIGTHTIYALMDDRFNRGLAVEPEPRNANLFRQNMALNELTSQVEFVEAGASNRNGQNRLVIEQNNHGGHRMTESYETAQSVEIDIHTIDALVQRSPFEIKHIGLVWIDVQGHELSVLEGMWTLRQRSVPFVVAFSPSASESTADRLKELTKPFYKSVVDLETPTDVCAIDGFTPVDDSRFYLFFGTHGD